MRRSLTRRRFLIDGAVMAGMASTAVGMPIAIVAAEAALAAPRLNQVGFLPTADKHFSIPVDGATDAPFTVEDLQGHTVFTGALDPTLFNLAMTTGEHVQAGDFSALTMPGRYRLRVGSRTSAAFTIGAELYAPLLVDAARCFSIIRANVALDDPRTGLQCRAGHLSDATLPVGADIRDLSGGWYNAGDYGKWTPMAALTASEMMWLWELRPEMAGRDLAIPPIYPGLPDLLQLARWGLDWLLKMQNPDGSVLHKVDTEPNFAWGRLPEEDHLRRAARGPSSLDSAVFVGVVGQASRVFAPHDAAFASRCRAAAEAAWHWLQANPSVTQDDPYYGDKDASQEIAWASAEMAVLRQDPLLMDLAWQRYVDLGRRSGNPVLPFVWSAPHLLGAMALARFGTPTIQGKAIEALDQAASQLAETIDSDPYGFSTHPADYVWSSLETALDRACVCLFAYEVTRQPSHRTAGQHLLDYALGHNALDRSFVTGYGTRRTEHPYHWTYKTLGLVMPGWPSGGPNGARQGTDPLLAAVIAAGTPPAKCYVDACENNGSWASNEGTTSETAALLLAVGLYTVSR